MSKLQDEGVKHIISYINEHNYHYIYFILISALLLSSAITWLIASRKSRTEILKLKSEIKKLNVDHLKEIQLARDNHNKNSKEIEVLLRNILSSVTRYNSDSSNDNMIKVQEDWMNLTSFYCNDFINSFERYIELKTFDVTRKQRKTILKNDIFHFLSVTETFYRAINDTNILNITTYDKFRFTKETFIYRIIFIKENTSFVNIKIRKNLFEKLKNIEIITPPQNFLIRFYKIYFIAYC
ncbi:MULTISPECIES: hypothetical protein [Bacillus]|uniref:hypothetical protein n=1 Tax=Bacillus TaxID=1386 RepID=UPI000BFB8F40|nr:MULTISPECIES: hypothetical protein [Bacillus]MBY7100565.1 hypothetical protein [Bacillus sp. 6YEL31]PHB19779.1 hypothetical protein COE88_22685 [Bacillus toyonensis]